METVNLKTAISLRVDLGTRVLALTTKTFRGDRRGNGTIPEAKDHVVFEVTDVLVDASEPWFPLPTPIRITVLWSNVLGVQYEHVAERK